MLSGSRGWLRKLSPTVYAVILVAALVGTLAVKVRFRGVFACPASYGAAAYLSDCNAANYGDYDHGAFWFGLEPEASRAAAEANVLFIGNSRLQFALSTPQTTEWFTRNAISFYLLGFSHSETVAYMAPVLRKIDPRASVYVIHVDRFFDSRISPPTAQLQQERDIGARYREKQVWQSLHKPVCGALPLLCGNQLGIYRTRANGTWRTAGARPQAKAPVSDGAPTNVDRWPEYVSIAKKFVGELRTRRQCVLLTLVPTVDTKRAEAQEIANALGLPLIAPQVDGLKTFDGSHLEPASAARWSAAFLEAAGPIIQDCAANRPSSASNDHDPGSNGS
ncbi:MAG TPA: hypothetical protein VLW55_06520 [Burkholderiaceae bacterium]|nr:hypothetical protein [Burkholderiaceae bacterium]